MAEAGLRHRYSEEDLTDRFVHLTNAAVQKKHAEFKARGEEAILSMPQLQAALEAEGSVPPHWAHAVLRPQLQALCREVCVRSAAPCPRRRVECGRRLCEELERGMRVGVC